MILVSITGASGWPYAISLMKSLLAQENIYLIVSEQAKVVFFQEMGHEYQSKDSLCQYLNQESLSRVIELDNKNMMATPASGTGKVEAMVIIPCTMNTLAMIQGGIGNTLILRAADVMRKERKPLILVPREMPFSSIHLKNMYELSLSGVDIISASPSFYHHPNSIDSLIQSVSSKVLSRLGREKGTLAPWEGKND